MGAIDTYVGRLAPSPTGALHLGNARSFLIAWLHCRKNRGRLQLRIEDLHMQRIKPGAVQQIFDDLKWLGMDWDEGPQDVCEFQNKHHDFVQSLNIQRYQNIFDDLLIRKLIYPCYCTRKEIEMIQSAPHGEHELRYPGTCRDRNHSTSAAMGLQEDQPRREPSWRFITDDEPTEFFDGLYGQQHSIVKDWSGDFVIAQNRDNIGYQLAVVVDDHYHRVTNVIRGNDLLASTHRQLQIYRALNWTPPHFLHLPLLIGSDGRRLAKRHGDWKICTLRELGHRPQKILGLLAYTMGLNPQKEDWNISEFLNLFSLETIPTQAFVLDESIAFEYGVQSA